ncbi:hypothetical protein NPIL_621671 [Nephila pilipes]|uniref:Uncharacterized protein n=1 Tax=Nephila pilipes TaxID=299642 RepID=A0A8X6UVJ5_NEPPI|nr:hypothetical protein NPIL_621671 [Nephila pilipes]
MRIEGSTESSNNHERQHRSKRRPPVRRIWRKRSASSSLVENIEVKRRPHGSLREEWLVHRTIRWSPSEVTERVVLCQENNLSPSQRTPIVIPKTCGGDD